MRSSPVIRLSIIVSNILLRRCAFQHILLACALVAGSVLAGCEEEEERRDVAVVPANAPDDESWRATISYVDSNRQKAVIRVGHARRSVSRAETRLDSGVYVQFFAPDGSINATLVADSARLDDRTRDMSAYGAVHVESARGERIVDTDSMFWNNTTRRLKSAAPVKVVDNIRGQKLSGIGFESDEGLRNYSIYKPTGTFRGGE